MFTKVDTLESSYKCVLYGYVEVLQMNRLDPDQIKTNKRDLIYNSRVNSLTEGNTVLCPLS